MALANHDIQFVYPSKACPWPGDMVRLWPIVVPNSLPVVMLRPLSGVIQDYVFTGKLRTLRSFLLRKIGQLGWSSDELSSALLPIVIEAADMLAFTAHRRSWFGLDPPGPSLYSQLELVEYIHIISDSRYGYRLGTKK